MLVTQSVNVEASVAALQTENATVGTTINLTEIAELPLNGRNFVRLARLIPGALPALPVPSRSGGGGVPSARATAEVSNCSGARCCTDRRRPCQGLSDCRFST